MLFLLYYNWGDSGEVAPPTPPVVAPSVAPSGGFHPYLGRLPRKKKHGIPQEVDEIIKRVAASQVERLETDRQKQFEELERELELRALRWERKYLTALAEEREYLIHQEIGRLLKRKLDREDEDILVAMLLAMIS